MGRRIFVFLIFHPSSKADGSAVDKTTEGYYQHGKLPLNAIKETLFCCCFSFLRERGGCQFTM